MSKKDISLAIVLLVVILGALSYFLLSPKPATKYPAPVGQITVAGYADYAPFVFIASKRGSFDKNGLRATVNKYETGRLAMEALLKNEADVATAADFVFASESFNHNDIKIIATVSVSEDTHEFIGRRDKGINQISDIRGKRIGVTKKTSGEFFLGNFLILNNLKLSDITMVDLKPSELKPALESGAIDGTLTWEPYVFDIKKELGEAVVSFPAQIKQNLFFVIIAKNEFIEKNPEIIKRFLRSLIEEESQLDAESVSKYLKIELRYTPEYIDIFNKKFKLEVGLPQALLLAMETEARWLIENKLTDKTELPNYLGFIHFDTMETLRLEAVTIIHE